MKSSNELSQKSNVSTAIPVIDLHLFLVGDTEARKVIAEQIASALQEIGCFYLKNHDIPTTLIAQTFAQAKSFFALPLEEKKQLALTEKCHRGYIPMGMSSILSEQFYFGREMKPEELDAVDHPFHQPNQWLQNPPEFREVMLQFFTACHASTLKILEALAIALNLPESYFADLHSEQNHAMGLHHYLGTSELSQAQNIRLGEHTDGNTITYLFQHEIEGLELCSKNGEIIPVPLIPDTVVVMAGEILQRWTNDQVYATKHQVAIPFTSQGIQPRYSFAFFASPNNDAEIACPDNCLNANKTAKYPPIITRDFYHQRNNQNKSLLIDSKN
ncbi:isopenicillin N synthase family dioxygenase [Nodularia sphaerocarpa]|uniref:isopenicillin N synthase family dioxygenase n=1 Tax=Nodularia sphaerocarpa TaxID=137816 RepID=UPI001EFA37E8|nr:2-oxoglutarate and iron-dependent oxygenase domain-containing protein [Nodularia sphaerocarpa]MDB9373584.1 2-oxoglutarate and iron-dependent oxygenase domain-containing protein [Nodularia sphaerocarpa CS-585]MDB9378031.1 2-oxoglutarate and iron-dependent oxygenase domain-containing protein [Nodularia sphaerocarpa CS-585A2]ULP74372.1 putative dioxygenase [Nodularia sphaerocarpa UHCC 0038]